MLAMLEKYANHLEELVAERTSELDAEKKKTEKLLYRMLPQSVFHYCIICRSVICFFDFLLFALFFVSFIFERRDWSKGKIMLHSWLVLRERMKQLTFIGSVESD